MTRLWSLLLWGWWSSESQRWRQAIRTKNGTARSSVRHWTRRTLHVMRGHHAHRRDSVHTRTVTRMPTVHASHPMQRGTTASSHSMWTTTNSTATVKTVRWSILVPSILVVMLIRRRGGYDLFTFVELVGCVKLRNAGAKSDASRGKRGAYVRLWICRKR